MAKAKPSSKRQTRNPASTAPATTSDPPWAFAAFSGVAALLRGDLATAACIAFAHLNFILLSRSLRWLQSSPPGSVARHRARLAVTVLFTTLTASLGWKMFAPMRTASGILVWTMAVVASGLAYYACTFVVV